MHVANAVLPEGGQIQELLEMGGNAPIVMLNLLKFRDRAEYDASDQPDMTGREAYLLYGEPMKRIVESHGGRFLLSAGIEALVIGEVDALWDATAIVEYPSRAAFVAIATSPAVQAIGHHRKAGLAGQLLIQCAEFDGAGD